MLAIKLKRFGFIFADGDQQRRGDCEIIGLYPEHILLGPGAVDAPGVSIGMEVQHRLAEGAGSNAKGHEKCLMHSRRHRMGKNDRRAHMLVETTKVSGDPRGVFRKPLGPLRCIVDGPTG